MTVTKLFFDRTNCICNSFLLYYYDGYTPAIFFSIIMDILVKFTFF